VYFVSFVDKDSNENTHSNSLGTQLFFGKAAKKRVGLNRRSFPSLNGGTMTRSFRRSSTITTSLRKAWELHLSTHLYRFIDREGNILALRPEFTSLVAKSVATRLADQPKPLRLLLRRSTPLKLLAVEGNASFPDRRRTHRRRAHPVRCRDHSGRDRVSRSWASGDFKSTGRDGLLFRHRRADEFLADDLSKIKTLVDLKDTVGLRLELERLALSDKRRNILLSLVHLTGNSDTLQTARQLVSNEKSLKALDHLEALLAELKKYQVEDQITIDLREVRGQDYYTGTIFKIYVPGLGFEIGGGGRYDNLFKNFGCDFPSVTASSASPGTPGWRWENDRRLLIAETL
jgi:ATP phosphoribosyltransferase regulatory subunit